MDWEAKICVIQEFLSEIYSHEGLKTKICKCDLIDENHYDVSVEIFNQEYLLSELSFGVGFLKRSGFIYELEVQDSVRRQGYGTKIVKGLEETLKNFNFEQIHLIPKDSQAENFWKKRGYRPLASRMIKFL